MLRFQPDFAKLTECRPRSATPLISSRVRFCLSAAHTKHDIDLILRACDEIGDILDLKTGKNRWSADEVIRRAEELVHEN